MAPESIYLLLHIVYNTFSIIHLLRKQSGRTLFILFLLCNWKDNITVIFPHNREVRSITYSQSGTSTAVDFHELEKPGGGIIQFFLSLFHIALFLICSSDRCYIPFAPFTKAITKVGKLPLFSRQGLFKHVSSGSSFYSLVQDCSRFCGQ